MNTFLKTTALAAGILALGTFGTAPAMAWDKHRHHGWYHGHGHSHGYRMHRGPKKKVVVVKPQRRVVHTRRVVVVTAPPPRIIYQAVPVAAPMYAPLHFPGHSAAYCREYTQTVVIGGVRQMAYGTACQQPDGSWRPMN